MLLRQSNDLGMLALLKATEGHCEAVNLALGDWEFSKKNSSSDCTMLIVS